MYNNPFVLASAQYILLT